MYTMYKVSIRYIYIYIRCKLFVNDILYILENVQIYWKNFGQSYFNQKGLKNVSKDNCLLTIVSVN